MNLLKNSTQMLVESVIKKAGGDDITFSALKNSASEKETYADSAVEAFKESFGDEYKALGPIGMKWLNEDAAVAHQMILNNLEQGNLNESADVRFLTASTATVMRQPMEANIHRAFDVNAATSQIITFENVYDTLTNADNEKIDAYSAFDNSTFINTVIESLDVGTNGIVPTRTAIDLLAGHNKSIHTLDKSASIRSIGFKEGGVAVLASKIKPARGSNPYFDLKTGFASLVFEVTGATLTYKVKVDAMIDFGAGTLKSLDVDMPAGAGDLGVTKVYFDLRLAHDSHASAITMGIRNDFKSLNVGTAPHFEVAESMETLADINKNESSLKGRDLVSLLSDKMITYSALKEDLILFNELSKTGNHMYELTFDYESPSSYAAGSPFEWIKLNLVSLMDLACTQMKREYHVKNAVFKILVSPTVLRIIDNGYRFDDAESIISVLNYSVTAKTAANTLIFISSERYDELGQINMILGDKENQIVKTFEYWKYQSFLTDALQSSKNNARKAITFTERNLAVIMEPVATKVEILNMPHKRSDKNKIVKVM